MRFSAHVRVAILKACIVLGVIGFFQSVAFSQAHQFVHPGISWSQSDLDQLAAHTTISPWSDGWSQIVNSEQGSLDYAMEGPFVEVTNKGANQSEHTSDAQAALYHAFQWQVTGDLAHGALATQILDAWATTHTTWSGTSIHLHAAWRGGMMVQAAEILRYTYPGWTQQNTDHCEAYFLNTLYPQFRLPNPLRSANQGANNIWGAVQVAIFCNDQQKFQDCLDAYLNDPCGGISNSLPNGQCGDSGRDQGHAGAMIGNLSACAQIFFAQGVDVYGVLDNRLLKMMEYWCQYNSGEDVEFVDHGTCYGYYTSIGADGRRPDYGDFASAYESVRAAYVVRKGLDAPHTLAYINRIDPQIDTFFNRKDDSFTGTATRSREAFLPFSNHTDVTSLTDVEIGNTSEQGSSNLDSNNWALEGSGNGLNERSISYHFAYTQLSGDGEMIARVLFIEDTDPDADAALVIRPSLNDPQGPSAAISVRPDQGTQFSARNFDAADGNGTQTFSLANLSAGSIWLKLERRGNRIVGYTGPDGITWAPMQHVIYDDWPEDVFIGLAATSHNNSELATAVFTDVQISSQPELSVADSYSNNPPTVSSNDLAQTAFLSSSAVSGNELATEHGQLFNGLIGDEDGRTDDVGEVRMNSGDSFTINFDTTTQPMGYDISQIDSFFGWNIAAGGRSNQGYGVRFDRVDGTSQVIDASHWAPNDPPFFWTTVSFTESSGGVIATGVSSITFNITERAIPRGHVIAREFDIYGSPTGGSDFLLGDCNLNGVVDFSDIAPFIQILASDGFLGQADINQDDVVDFSDIAPFIVILSN